MDTSPVTVTSELYLLPTDLPGEPHIAFFPLQGLVLLVNDDLAQLLSSIRGRSYLPANESQENVLGFLKKMGATEEETEEPRLPRGPFCPTTATLFLTSRCNLACVYCYADANRWQRDIPFEMAEAAMRLSVRNACEAHQPSASLSLHGGGEPTLNWRLFCEIVERFRKLCTDSGMRPLISVTTNAHFDLDRADYIAQNLSGITISLDGIESVQNAQRPTRSGKGTYRKVVEATQRIAEQGLDFCIRSTVMRSSVAQMPEATELFARLGAEKVRFDPVFLAGRARDMQAEEPAAEDFVAAFREARDVGKSRGIDVSFAGVSLGRPKEMFCRSAIGGFALTPDGNITACYEITEAEDPRSDLFWFGRYDPATREFRIDAERYRRLQELCPTDRESCRGCFARWSCAGGCLVKSIDGVEYVGPEALRCAIIKPLTYDRLLEEAQKHAPETGSSLEAQLH